MPQQSKKHTDAECNDVGNLHTDICTLCLKKNRTPITF